MSSIFFRGGTIGIESSASTKRFVASKIEFDLALGVEVTRLQRPQEAYILKKAIAKETSSVKSSTFLNKVWNSERKYSEDLWKEILLSSLYPTSFSRL